MKLPVFSFAFAPFVALTLCACVSDDNAAAPIADASPPVTPPPDASLPTYDGGSLPDATADAGPSGDTGGGNPPDDAGAAGDAGLCLDAGTGRCVYLLATGQGNPEGLALSGGYLYWIEEGIPGRIQRMLLPDGPIELLATGYPASSTLAVDATRIYWTQEYDGIVYAAPNTGIVDGGAPTVLAVVDGGGTSDLVVDTSRAYWTDFNAGRVYAAPLTGLPDGGAPSILASAQAGPSQLATDGTNLYWTNYSSGDVMALSLSDGGAPVTLASGVTAASAIQVLAGTVYVASDTKDTIYSLPVTGVPDAGAPSVFQDANPILDASPQNLTDFVFDGTNVYWSTNGNPGGQVLTATPGGAATPLALGMTSPGSLTYDATYLYWGNFAYGEVYKVAK